MPRIAIVDKEKCQPMSCGNYLCIRKCPINRQGDECIYKDDDGKVGIDEGLCIGCNICVKVCPFDALTIVNMPEKLEHPIHRYGRNGFHLYNLPIPLFGKVVGLLGKNGLGKSTAMNVLSGLLKPNLGKEDSSYEELISFFKGTEAQAFFEKVHAGTIKVSYKPQQVDLIPKNASGTVRALLEKVDEREKMQEIAEKLEITRILDNDIKTISGGELQRVAIAAAVLKKANLYIFDEPTSYLDIKQRMKVSRFIRELATPDVAVLVVEHDLIVLDYLTDLVHIMYGKPGAYGVISLPMSSRAGINAYLEGYLREENMRFRDHAIKFEPKPPMNLTERPEIISWKGIKKQLDNFSLESAEGVIKRGQVIGILGENGTGKTSFVKILAEVIPPDSGDVRGNVKVSYKPQYLQTDSDELVGTVLKDACDKYFNQLIVPLQLKGLLERQLNQLSGGELQRVAIVRCLSQEADLYLMDEPSAYLDSEQRLAVSKVIREQMFSTGRASLIVDHDLLFLDYVSQFLMLFEGEPAIRGVASGPFSMQEGMNRFLEKIGLTFRRDPESYRPRANKPGSQLDRQQKKEGKLYYI